MPLWFDEFSITWSTCKILSTCTLDRFVWILQHVGVGKGPGDFVKACWPSPSGPAPRCGSWSAVFSVCCHNNYPGTCISFSIYFLWIHLPQGFQFQFVDTIFLFFFFLKRFRYLYFYDCSVFTALYFSFIFWENSKDNAHLLFFNPTPLTKKKPTKKWERGERKKDKQNNLIFFFHFVIL